MPQVTQHESGQGLTESKSLITGGLPCRGDNLGCAAETGGGVGKTSAGDLAPPLDRPVTLDTPLLPHNPLLQLVLMQDPGPPWLFPLPAPDAPRALAAFP